MHVVEITNDTEDDSSILDISECVSNNECNETKMVSIDSAFAERCGEYNEQIKVIKKEVFEDTEKCIFKNKRAHIKKLKIPTFSVGDSVLSRTLITKV